MSIITKFSDDWSLIETVEYIDWNLQLDLEDLKKNMIKM